MSSEFLYNQQDPRDVVYQKLAMAHYKKYPIDKQYTYVKSAFWMLKQMYESESRKLKESSLYLATKHRLILAYKKLYGNETTDSLSKSQFAVVLPIFLEKEGRFVDEVLRLLFIEAGWTSELDFKSKLVFFGELEASLYAYQQQPTTFDYDVSQRIIREKKYMRCLIQRGLHDGSVTLTLDIIQMKFDKHFIAASRSSISSSGTELLAPQFTAPSKTIPIQNWVSKKILQLLRFLLSRIFTDSPGKISFAQGDLYGFYLNNKYHNERYLTSLIEVLISIAYNQNLTKPQKLKGTNGFFTEDILSRSHLWQQLDQKERNNFTAITYREILEFFLPMDMSSVLDDIEMYAREHEFSFGSAEDIVFIEDVVRETVSGMQRTCLSHQIRTIRESIFNETRRGYDSANHPLSEFFWQPAKGILFKILTMIQMSNKLKEPVILHSEPKQSNLKWINDTSNTRKETILERLSGYSFYVDAKIMRNQQIKLYLHQVIETQNGKEKSTLLWSVSQEHLPVECTSALGVYDHYQHFKSRLSLLIEEMFNTEISMDENIHDLQYIHKVEAECDCHVQISHKMILDMGVKHYLNSIARCIVACVRNPATFGKYKPKVVIITGSLLSEWTSLKNTLYRNFIWSQLEKELCLAIHQHQMKVHIIMSHTDVDLFSDEHLIRREKYQQVVGDKRILVDVRSPNISGTLYEDKGDRYELVPCIKIDEEEHWRFHLIQNDETLLRQSGILSRYYMNPRRDLLQAVDPNDSYNDFGAYFYIKFNMCSSQDQQEILSRPLKEEATMMASVIYAGPVRPNLESRFGDCSFPMVFTLEPKNYQLKTRLSLVRGCNNVTTTLLYERMTLKRLHHEDFNGYE
ncbi:hypothetical protein MAM1_0074d04269 [Mucor ambiguus]|uniref:Uncharacterized protein n=1 Tax=Mucor ambiguus TaxID=91626 RepID=A0A0C9MBZ2_9FUNG|nr:hypothetical protein MAM1_0074d04269 [Mucor ambiguus]